jgi:hypothetical protein
MKTADTNKRYILRVYNKKNPLQYVDTYTNNPKRRRKEIRDDILAYQGHIDGNVFDRFAIFFELEGSEIGYEVFRKIGYGVLATNGMNLTEESMRDELEIFND